MKVLATTSLGGIESFLKKNSGKIVQVTVRNPLPFVEEYDTFIHLDSKGVETDINIFNNLWKTFPIFFLGCDYK